MNNVQLRVFYVLALASIISLVSLQVFWFRKAYDQTEIQFHKNVRIALEGTLKQLLQFNGQNVQNPDGVKQLEDNYYAVLVNDQINADVLEYYLRTQFELLNMHHAFEYRIYDCQNDQLQYGGFVDGKIKMVDVLPQSELPSLSFDNYYFTVYFPQKSISILSTMNFWLASSLTLAVLLIFFVYSLSVIFKQKQLAEVQRDFINHISHEVKTPLAAISASAETIQRSEEIANSLRLGKYLRIILEESNRLQHKIEKVLDTGMGKRIIKFQKERLNIRELMEQLVAKLVNNPNYNVKINFNHDDLQKEEINADAQLLESALFNILENAIKYSRGTADISIAMHSSKNLNIYISDNGIGIPKKYLHRIFDDFFRVPSDAAVEQKGFGVGLSYTKSIIKLHHGKISVSSEINKGSTFHIQLPIHEQ